MKGDLFVQQILVWFLVPSRVGKKCLVSTVCACICKKLKNACITYRYLHYIDFCKSANFSMWKLHTTDHILCE